MYKTQPQLVFECAAVLATNLYCLIESRNRSYVTVAAGWSWINFCRVLPQGYVWLSMYTHP
jgi:hypothetical protein